MKAGLTLLHLFIFGLILVGLIGCDSDDGGSMPTVSITQEESFVAKGQQVQLQVTGRDASGSEISATTVNWSSNAPGILDVSNSGLITGINRGEATISASVDGVTGTIDFEVVDLTGTWTGGEDGDTVKYILTQTGTNVIGTFESSLGFPPITNVNTGVLTGSLEFARYNHTLELVTENDCVLQISGSHFVQKENDELVLKPSDGFLSSTNCSINGTIDFAWLRQE